MVHSSRPVRAGDVDAASDGISSAMPNADHAILVVEDEPLILMAISDELRDAGFVVYEARHAAEGLALLETHADIRVLFTDVDMPGSMDGLALAHAARDRWPPVHVIVTSGHRAMRNADLPARGVFVPKPYDHRTVVQQINRMAA